MKTILETVKGIWCPDCASYNLGFPLKTCLRICSVIGMISAFLYIICGTTLISHIAHNEKATFSFLGQSSASESTRHIYYKRNADFFIGISIVLVLINFVQLGSDALLFHSTLQNRKSHGLWIFFTLDVVLWILTLICFVTIFSGGGLFLLLVFLLGTGIRAYIVFILHEFIAQDSKIQGDAEVAIYPTLSANTTESNVKGGVTLAELGKTSSYKLDKDDYQNNDVSSKTMVIKYDTPPALSDMELEGNDV